MAGCDAELCLSRIVEATDPIKHIDGNTGSGSHKHNALSVMNDNLQVFTIFYLMFSLHLNIEISPSPRSQIPIILG